MGNLKKNDEVESRVDTHCNVVNLQLFYSNQALMLDNVNAIFFKGKWTAEEEQRLSCAVHELCSTSSGEYITAGISWASVAERVGTRSEKQCRSKWYML